MKNLSLLLTLQLFLTSVPVLAEDSFEDFFKSVYRHQIISTSRMARTVQGIHLAQPSLLEKWGYINTEAAAAYNPWINTIILKPEYTLRKSQGLGFKMKTWEQMQGEPGAMPAELAALTFHELSHAEYQKLDKSPFAEDRDLAKLLKNDLVGILRRQGVGIWNSWLAASEYFAYYREDVFRLLTAEIESVLMSNGIRPGTNLCYGGSGLRRKWEKVPANAHGKFQLFDGNRSYSEKDITPSAVVRSGKEIPIDITQQPFKNIHSAVWLQMVKEFALPTSREQLVEKINSSMYREQLIHCQY